jgi:hypothetical protein
MRIIAQIEERFHPTHEIGTALASGRAAASLIRERITMSTAVHTAPCRPGKTPLSAFLPNTTPFPTVLLAEWLPALTGDEWKLVSVIAARSFGAGFVDLETTLASLSAQTGLRPETITALLMSLAERRLLFRQPLEGPQFWLMLHDGWRPEGTGEEASR